MSRTILHHPPKQEDIQLQKTITLKTVEALAGAGIITLEDLQAAIKRSRKPSRQTPFQ